MAPRVPDAESWIRKTHGVCGGEACVRNTRHTVAGLVEWRSLGLTDEEVLRHHPDLTLGDLDAAFEYYRQNTKEIERIIAWKESPRLSRASLVLLCIAQTAVFINAYVATFHIWNTPKFSAPGISGMERSVSFIWMYVSWASLMGAITALSAILYRVAKVPRDIDAKFTEVCAIIFAIISPVLPVAILLAVLERRRAMRWSECPGAWERRKK